MFSVMEVACGEYGDMVPSLVVSNKMGKAEQFQKIRKVTNCEKGAYGKDNIAMETHTKGDNQTEVKDTCNGDVIDGELPYSQSNGHLTTRVSINDKGPGIDTTLLSKELGVSYQALILPYCLKNSV